MKCKDCDFREISWMMGYDGRGMIEFSYCNLEICNPRMVDPEIDRECENIPKREGEKTDAELSGVVS